MSNTQAGSLRSMGIPLDDLRGLQNQNAFPAKQKGILEEALEIVHSDRQQQYGTPQNNFTKIGRMWGAILGIPDIEPRIVAIMLVSFKVARESYKHNRDNLVDIAGYTECADLCSNT